MQDLNQTPAVEAEVAVAAPVGPMIYAKEATAKGIATKLSANGVAHIVVQVTNGWQVSQVTKIVAKEPKPLPVAKKKAAKAAEHEGEGLAFTFQFYSDSPKSFVIVGAEDGEMKYLRKSEVLWSGEPENGEIEIKVVPSYTERLPVSGWAVSEYVERTVPLIKDGKNEVIVELDGVLVRLNRGRVKSVRPAEEAGMVILRALPGVFTRAVVKSIVSAPSADAEEPAEEAAA